MADDDLDLVPVYGCGDTVKLGFAKSVLEGEDIPCAIQGEAVQDLFGWGRMGTGVSFITGPAQLIVRREDLGRATELLSEFLKEDGELSP